MRIFRFVSATVVAGFTFASAAQAATITLDFDGIGDGGIVSDGTSSTGVYTGISISALNTGGGPNLAVAYDSGGAIGRDSDLEENRYASNFTNAATGLGGHTGFGNLLIVQENNWGCSADGICDSPDDEAGGGALRFVFEQMHLLRSFDYFDVDGAPDQQAETVAVRLFTTPDFDWSDPVNGTDVQLVSGLLSTGGDNTFRTHNLASPQFIFGIEFEFSSSGAIDNLVLETLTSTEEIPAPAPLALLILGVFCLGFAARRQLTA